MITVSSCLWCGSDQLEPFARRKDGVGIVECKKCKLVMVDRFPENLDEFYYTEEYYNAGETNVDTGYAEIYDLMAPAFLFWQNSFIEEANEKHATRNFLEIGCATGNLLEILRDNQKNLVLKGIDISEYAAGAARHKGFDAEVAYIEKYDAKPKLDIIFSSETMEHLDNLKSFLEGVAKNLKDDGTFLFYVPSISMVDAEKDRDSYIRFNRNLEHLLHFSPEFMKKELAKFFDAEVAIKEFKTGFGPCIVGAVSKKPENLKDLKKLFAALEKNQVPRDASDTLLKNLIVFALKFVQFDLADKAFAEIEKRGTGAIAAPDKYILQGLLGYHKGELDKSNKAFEEFLKLNPGSLFAVRSLLSNEREMSKMMRDQIYASKEESLELTAKLADTKTELKNLRDARIIKAALLIRRIIWGIVNRLRWFKKKIRSAARLAFVTFVPAPVRKDLLYLRSREWMVKHSWIDNEKPQNQSLLTVVIPYYNRASTIGETMDSLRAQTFRNFDVIVVDDGSAKETNIDTVDESVFRDLTVKIIKQKNQGVAAARNTGISHAASKYILCLDSDDMLDPTCLEKFLLILETHPDLDVVSSDMRHFGVNNFVYKEGVYDPGKLLENNMLTTASMFTREGWEKTGGYKSKLGYEDWEFWINLAEHGFWGMNIPEPLLNYRTAPSSRYLDDQTEHKENLRKIRDFHPRYRRNIKQIGKKKRFNRRHLNPETMFINLDNPEDYKRPDNGNPNILITIPWMTFGGAETLIYNFCKEVKDKFNISYVTGLHSTHEWEYMFKEISEDIYHLPHFSDDKVFYLEFVSHYIRTRNIGILHVIHNGFTFEMLEELKKRHPELKVIVTLFNDRTEYFAQSVESQKYIDVFATDNQAVAKHFEAELDAGRKITVIPNGIDCYNVFKQDEANRGKERTLLRIDNNELAVFFVGRLSVEKNPDVFVEVARKILKVKKIDGMRFFVIGDGPMRPGIERAIEEVDDERLSYLGYQPPQDVAKYLNAADIFVLPSSTEGFPLSLLEAMAIRLVPVASKVGAVPDVLEESKDGYIISPPGSAEAIVKVLEKLNKNRGLADEIKTRARFKIEEHYSNRKLGENYVRMYREELAE